MQTYLAGEGGVDQGRSRALLPSFFNSSNSSSLMEMGLPCGEDEEGQIKEKSTARDPKILKINSQGGGSSTPSPKNQRQGESTRKEKK